MTIRVYLMPTVVGTRGVHTLHLPKYLSIVDGPTPADRPSATMFIYGQEDVCLFVVDTNAAQDAALTANADVRSMPDNLDTTVTTAARTQIVNALESLNVPAQWIANGQTFRTVLRRLVGIFSLLENVHGRGFRFLQASLDSQISTLPANVRQSMQDAAAALQLDTSGITGTTTLRVALATIGAQFDSRPVFACKTSL